MDIPMNPKATSPRPSPPLRGGEGDGVAGFTAGLGFDARLFGRASRRGTQGFTIIEIMMAMAIFAMVVAAIFASWQAIARGAVSGNRAAATAQRSRVALRTIEEALGATRSFTADIEYYTFDADNGSEPYLSFVSMLSPSFPRSGRFGEFNVRRVTFSVEAGQANQKRLVLRQTPVLMDMDEDEQNSPVVLAKDVKKFEMSFWDKQKADWLDEWTQTNQLPQMVRFTLQLNSEQGEMTRIVALPSVAVQSGWQIPGSTLGPRSGGIGGGLNGGINGGGARGGIQLPTPGR
jgi:type II secretion system protein J